MSTPQQAATDTIPQADQHLTPGHTYLWGDKLVQANKAQAWSLLVIDRQTGFPVAHVPGHVVGYIHVRGQWYETLAAENGARTVGAAVAIDFTQFHATATAGVPTLEDKAMYSDGQNYFAANRGQGEFPWMLFRFTLRGGVMTKPGSAGSLAGYMLDRGGNWHTLKVGDHRSKRPMVLTLCPEFATEIMPTLKRTGSV